MVSKSKSKPKKVVSKVKKVNKKSLKNTKRIDKSVFKADFVLVEDNGVPPSISKLFRDFSKEVYESTLKCLKDYKHESIDITGSQYLHGALESLRQLKHLAISFDRELQATIKNREECLALPEILFRIEESIAGIINFIRYSVQNSKHYKNDEHLSNFLYLLNKYEQDSLLDEVKNGR